MYEIQTYGNEQFCKSRKDLKVNIKSYKIYIKSLNLKDMNNSVNIKCENLKF